MSRTQLLLDDWQLEALRALGERTGESISALVRAAVSAYLGGAKPAGPRRQRLDDIAGVIEDPAARGRDHDATLYPPVAEPVVAARESAVGYAPPRRRRSPRPAR